MTGFVRRIFLLFVLLGVNPSPLFCQDLSTRDLIIKGVDSMMEGHYTKSLELLTQARIKAEEENDYINQFIAINNIGLNYHRLLDTNKALEYYLKSYTIAIKELDASYEMTSLNNIAILYSQDKNLDKALEYFHKAYKLAAKEKDSLKNGIYSINLAQVYAEKDLFKDALPYAEKAIALLQNEPDYLLEAKSAYALLQKDLKNPTKSQDLIYEILPQLRENRYAETRVALLLALSDIEFDKGDYTNALIHCKNALKEDFINLETKSQIYIQINKINRQAGDNLQALIAFDSIVSLRQAVNDLRSHQEYQANRVRFEVLNYENQILKDQQRIQFQRKLILVIIISSFLVISLLGWSLYLGRIRSKQRRDLLLRQEQILNLELENEKTNKLLLEKQLKEKETKLLLQQEQHKNEIEAKNRKLSAKALYMVDRNRLIESIINDFEQSEKIKPSNEIRDYIRRLRSLLKSDEEWENFVQYFDEVNHGLLSKLKDKHDNLNANDIRFISYLYMNLSFKEIASIMNITPEACRKRKERISKKIELDDNLELYNYLSQI